MTASAQGSQDAHVRSARACADFKHATAQAVAKLAAAQHLCNRAAWGRKQLESRIKISQVVFRQASKLL